MNKSNSMPWPASREQINPAFIDNLAQKVAAATPESEKTSKAAILSIINSQIEAHYKKENQQA